MAVNVPSMIIEAECAAKRARISVNDLCERIEVNRATWQRWKAGKTEPGATAINRIEAVTVALNKGTPAELTESAAA